MEVDEDWYTRHDYFNLIVLPGIILVNCLYVFVDWSWYWIQFWSFFIYIMIDTVWLLLKPRSVPSPQIIIIHHVVCIIGWILPAIYEQIYADWISYGLLVEINTWFLIARRTWKSNLIFGVMFYICWVVLRLLMYPVILYRFSVHIFQELREERPVHYTGFIQWSFMLSLTVLNYKWTFDMLSKMLQKKEVKKGL